MFYKTKIENPKVLGLFDRLETGERKEKTLGYCVCTKGEKTMTLGFVYILENTW